MRAWVWVASVALSVGLGAGVGVSACEARLETRCVGGDGTCEPLPLPEDVPCFGTCDPDAGLGLTGALPCEVDVILDNCRRCHTDVAPLVNAPFTLLDYDDTQALQGGQFVWFRMKKAIETDFMPLQPPKLDDLQKAVLLDWICECAPPGPPDQACGAGGGGGAGAGGAGGLAGAGGAAGGGG